MFDAAVNSFFTGELVETLEVLDVEGVAAAMEFLRRNEVLFKQARICGRQVRRSTAQTSGGALSWGWRRGSLGENRRRAAGSGMMDVGRLGIGMVDVGRLGRPAEHLL